MLKKTCCSYQICSIQGPFSYFLKCINIIFIILSISSYSAYTKNLCYDPLLFVKGRKLYIMVCIVKNFRLVTFCFPWNSTRNFPLCKKNGIFPYIGCHFKITGFRIQNYWCKYLSSTMISMFDITTQLFYARQNTVAKKTKATETEFSSKMETFRQHCCKRFPYAGIFRLQYGMWS